MICPRLHYNKVQNSNKSLDILRELRVNKMQYSLVVRRERNKKIKLESVSVRKCIQLLVVIEM